MNAPCDPNNDIYTSPLMLRYGAVKRTGNERLKYAMWYLKSNRIRTLLCDYVNKEPDSVNPLECFDHFKNNILHLTCNCKYIPGAPVYTGHESLYDTVLFTILSCLPCHVLQALCNQTSLLGHNVIETCLISSSQCHYILALINYGLVPCIESQENHVLDKISADHCYYHEKQLLVTSIYFKSLGKEMYHDKKKKKITNDSSIEMNKQKGHYKGHQVDGDMLEFLQSKRVQQVYACSYLPGQKLWILCKGTCPITKQSFQNPAILISGHVFERDALINWCQSNSTHPITGKRLLHRVAYDFCNHQFFKF
jgi:hypothetical protein